MCLICSFQEDEFQTGQQQPQGGMINVIVSFHLHHVDVYFIINDTITADLTLREEIYEI